METYGIMMRQVFCKNAVVSISILFVTAVVQLLAKASFTESKCTSPQVEYYSARRSDGSVCGAGTRPLVPAAAQTERRYSRYLSRE